MGKDIIKTAFQPLVDLAKKTHVPYCGRVCECIENRVGEMSSSKMSHFAEARYRKSHDFIRDYSQVVEIASGFTPHAYHAWKDYGKSLERYIEIDFSKNLDLKSEAMKEAGFCVPGERHRLIGGNIYDDKVWDAVHNKLSLSREVGMFAEGFMMYTSFEDRKCLFEKISDLLKEAGGKFWFEDSLTFHPELENVGFRGFSRKMGSVGNNKNIANYLGQDVLTEEILDFGFDIERVPAYLNLSSRDFDEKGKRVLSRFKTWVLSLGGKK
jgi:O-methyltransferase involved in polyketide biosynthesis